MSAPENPISKISQGLYEQALQIEQHLKEGKIPNWVWYVGIGTAFFYLSRKGKK